MKLSDFPASDCCVLIWGILDRYHSAKGRQPFGKSIRTEVHLSIDDARMIWAAGQWLKKYAEWADEAKKSGGSIGVWPADTTLSFAAKWLVEKVSAINKDERIIILSAKDMKIMESVAQHLDHYHMMTSFKDGRRKR